MAGTSGTLRDLMTAVRGDVAGLSATVRQLENSVSAANARADAREERTRAEVDILFEHGREAEKRIGAIEKDYVPRAEHQRAQDQNDDAHDKQEQQCNAVAERVRGVELRLAKYIGIAVAVLTAAEIVINIVSRRVLP